MSKTGVTESLNLSSDIVLGDLSGTYNERQFLILLRPITDVAWCVSNESFITSGLAV